MARAVHHPQSKLRNIPILMLTGINKEFPLGFSPADINDSWLPVSDFLEKPVDFSILQCKVSQLIEEKKLKLES